MSKDSFTGSSPKRVKSVRILPFLANVKGELKKISWTPRKELLRYAKIVALSIFFCGMLVYSVDLLLGMILDLLRDLFTWLVL